jgi:two-component system, NarL family, sensor kinase
MYYLRNTAICFFALFFLKPYTILAQDNLYGDFEKRKDKAVSELKKFQYQDTARVNALIKVCTKAIFLKQQQQVKPYCDEALAISRKINYTKGLAQCYRLMGNFYKSSLNPSAAQTYFDSVIQISRDTKDSALLEQKAMAQRWKGMIYYDQENYYEALNYLFEALKYFEYEVGSATYSLYNIITIIYIRLNNLEQASFYAKKNVSLAEKNFNKVNFAQAYLTLTDISIQKGELHLGLYYLDKIKPYIPDSVETMLDCAYYENRGSIFYQMQQYDSSFSYYQQAYRYAEASKHPLYTNTALSFLTTIALKLGKTAAAKKYSEENMALAEKMNTKGGKIKALLNLSDYYHQTGNNNKAYDFLQKATLLKDSLISETSLKQVNTLAAIYETDKKQKEILKLQNEKQIQETSVKHKSTLNMIFIATIIGLLFFGYLAYRNFKDGQKITQQQQEIQQQKINDLEKDRQLLTVDAMLKGQEEERSRIAKDLHDGLGGMLSGVKLSFINMKEKIRLPAEDLKGFDQSVMLIDNTIGELRKVAHNLMPEVLVRFGLDEALKEYCNSIQASANIPVIYQQFGKQRKLSRQAEINIYRIVQELVNNALKHSDAKQIIVQLTRNQNKTGITVEDNGKGFDVKTQGLKKGAGMSNIKYRVNYFKGTLDINSQPGNGTSVNIELMT